MLGREETSGAGVTSGGGPPKSHGCRPVRGVGWKRSLHWVVREYMVGGDGER